MSTRREITLPNAGKKDEKVGKETITTYNEDILPRATNEAIYSRKMEDIILHGGGKKVIGPADPVSGCWVMNEQARAAQTGTDWPTVSTAISQINEWILTANTARSVNSRFNKLHLARWMRPPFCIPVSDLDSKISVAKLVNVSWLAPNFLSNAHGRQCERLAASVFRMHFFLSRIPNFPRIIYTTCQDCRVSSCSCDFFTLSSF